MCGFAALIEPGRTFDPSLLDSIDRDLFHRGPDSGGRQSRPGFALVFRRLAIIDPEAGSDQPMVSADGMQAIVFNGEIFNFRDLRRQLEERGVKFRTTGDTEVILEGYRVWGQEVANKLEGMFAFVIVDRKSNELFAARDPFGIKPLYMLQKRNLVGFASEMRPLSHLLPPEPDQQALSELVTFGWAAGNLSNLKNIELVEGGTTVSLSLSGGALKRRRFIDPLSSIEADNSITKQDAYELAYSTLQKSVVDHLVSDVGYAIELSGGVDSSLIAALASQAADRRLSSYSVNLGDFKHDERIYREMVVSRYPLDHHEIRMTGRDFADSLPRAIRHLEGPSAHAGCIFLMRLCDKLRQETKVVLTGEGADEFFGGYQRYELWRANSRKARFGNLLPARYWPDRWPFKGIKKIAGRDAGVFASVYNDPAQRESLFPELIYSGGARDRTSNRFSSFIDKIFAVDQSAYLQSLLMRQDKLSMAASVEARVPFTHWPLARVLNKIPRSILAPGGTTKPLLKQIAVNHLPNDLVYRRKIGLLLPIDEWLRDEKALKPFVEDLRNPNSPIHDYINRPVLNSTIDKFYAGNAGLSRDLFRTIGINVWLQSLRA